MSQGPEPDGTSELPTGFDLEELWQLCETPDAANDPLVGRDLGDVTLVRAIAEGGMGRVYEGMQRQPQRRVAVKVLRPGLASRDLVRRFLKESLILGRLSHPGISQIFTAGTCDVAGAQVPYFVMEFVSDAVPITRYVAQTKPSLEVVLRLYAGVCRAVAHGHAQGIVHRDLKPGNLLVDGAGNVKVIDFGVARGLDPAGPLTQTTEAGRLIGTMQYMSPEQLGNDPQAVDCRSDVYALGMILHELLEGKPPYDLSQATVVEAARIIDEGAPLPAERPGLPGRATRVVARCLARRPADRLADAAAVAAAIDDALAGRALEPSASPRPRWLPSRAVLGGVLASLLVVAAIETAVDARGAERAWTAAWAAIRGSVGRPVDRPAAQRLVFSYGFRTVLQNDADLHLVDVRNMKKWSESEEQPPMSYWGPVTPGEEGHLVYRFDFPEQVHRIELGAHLACWDFTRSGGDAAGRGTAVLEASRDGADWIVIEGSLTPPAWGRKWGFSGNLPASVTGGREVWLRIRCLVEGPEREYAVAQFCRSSMTAVQDVFTIRGYAH